MNIVCLCRIRFYECCNRYEIIVVITTTWRIGLSPGCDDLSLFHVQQKLREDSVSPSAYGTCYVCGELSIQTE